MYVRCLLPFCPFLFFLSFGCDDCMLANNKTLQKPGGMYNTLEGENFIPPGFADAIDTGAPTAYNASTVSFDGWLAGFFPLFSAADLARVKTLYPAAGRTEAMTAGYNDSYTRAGLVYRDTVLACPAYWMAGAARRGRYLGEYSIAPAKHASDTGWVRFFLPILLLPPPPQYLPFVLECPFLKKHIINNDLIHVYPQHSGTRSARSSKPTRTSTTATRAPLRRFWRRATPTR